MKKFNEIDFFISTGLIIAYSIIIIIEPKQAPINNYYLLQGYFVVGGWQVISMIVHILFRGKQPLSYVRRVYTGITLLCLVTMPMGFVMFAILLFVAPFMAIFYTCICANEVFKKVKRPLDYLK
ncbi:MAG: hypothetical protein ACKVOM_14510 [Ferruginibacter sp.]